MSRGDQREDIFLCDVDRYDFLKTLAEACRKTGWQVHAFCLMRNHYHLLEEFRSRWCLGNEAFRKECLEKMDGKVGENHPGEIRRETAEAKAERLIAEELTRLQWNQQDLAARSKSDPRKLAIAARLRQETTLSIRQIAERLHLGKPKGAKTNLHKSLNPVPRLSSELQLGL